MFRAPAQVPGRLCSARLVSGGPPWGVGVGNGCAGDGDEEGKLLLATITNTNISVTISNHITATSSIIATSAGPSLLRAAGVRRLHATVGPRTTALQRPGAPQSVGRSTSQPFIQSCMHMY